MSADETPDAKRALLLRGTGRWVVEYWDDDAEEWKMTIWRGIALSVALKEAKRLKESDTVVTDKPFRCRDVDTDNVVLADIL